MRKRVDEWAGAAYANTDLRVSVEYSGLMSGGFPSAFTASTSGPVSTVLTAFIETSDGSPTSGTVIFAG